MAGPTTEAVNDDVKELRADFHRFETAITADVRELSTQIRGLIAAIKLLAVLTLTSVAASIWWGATLTADVKNLGNKVEGLNSHLERLHVTGDRPVSKEDPRIVVGPEQAPTPKH